MVCFLAAREDKVHIRTNIHIFSYRTHVCTSSIHYKSTNISLHEYSLGTIRSHAGTVLYSSAIEVFRILHLYRG